MPVSDRETHKETRSIDAPYYYYSSVTDDFIYSNFTFGGSNSTISESDLLVSYDSKYSGDNSTDSNSMHIDHTASKMFQENATRFFESKNISIADLNITTDNLNDFLRKLIQISKPQNDTDVTLGPYESEACNYYCNGLVSDMSTGYKSVHGYISLVVSY